MFEDVTVNLAMFINIVIYILMFLILRVIYRLLVRKLYVNRIAKKIRTKTLNLFAEHYLEFGFKNREVFETKLNDFNKELKNRYNLMSYPINYDEVDIKTYKSYDEINESFKLRSINIKKDVLFYKIRVNRCKNSIKYKDSVKENRDSKLAELID